MSELNIFTEETQKSILNEMKVQNGLIKIIASGWNIDSWKAVQEIVRSGGGKRYFPVGTQFNLTSDWGTLVMTVLDHDHHLNPDDASAHTMTVGMADCIYGLQFDAAELLWANTTDSALPAGTYHFTAYKSDYDGDTKEDGVYQFTTTKPIPANGGFRHTTMGAWRSAYAQSYVLSGTFTTYDADCTVVESGLTCTLGSDGTGLGTFAKAYGDISVTMGKANSTQRNTYGSNNTLESNLRQFLNASGSGWFTKQTVFDLKPSYASSNGFLSRIDPEFAAILGAVDLTANRSTVYEVDGNLGGTDTMRDKVFLLSMAEVGFGKNITMEGSVLNYYDGATSTDRIKYDLAKSSARYWWLRSPIYWYANYVRAVSPSGALDNGNAYNEYGLAAACAIM